MDINFLIVGSGLFGSIIAEQISSKLKNIVTVIERRDHIGGNCFSMVDKESGIEYHVYGSHIFHTSDKVVWDYMNRFTNFNAYRHTVWSTFQGKVYPMPMNLHTVNSYYGKSLSPSEAHAFLQAEIEKEGITAPENLEEKAISLIGRPLYEAFIRGYTIKQWEKNPKELDPSIITRLPVRFTYNNRYFSDTYEGIPTDGYGKLFEKLLSNPLITVRLNTDFEDIRNEITPDTLVIYTGAIDRYFNYCYGKLEWRTVDFEAMRPNCADYQGTSVMNYADADVPYTRIHEFKHYHPERPDTGKTFLYREYSRFAGENDEPYYPVSTQRNRDLYAKYEALARQEKNVIFGGRLGVYRYFDMDDTVAAALETFRRIESEYLV